MINRGLSVSLVLALTLLVGVAPCFGTDRTSAAYVASQVALWGKRDGAAGSVIGEELSKCFAAEPVVLLKSFAKFPEDFHAWVSDLQYNTFTDYRAEDKVDRSLSRAYYGKLKSLMLAAAERAIRVPDVAAMAQEVRKQLQVVNVRFID